MAIDFTPHQLDAICYRSLDACVVAGPGSGKTTVLVERYRCLVEDHGFEPREILAITFTEKAAANMKAKLAGKFPDDHLRLRELESAWVSTIHGFCARLLREHAIAAGIDPRFVVLDARESEDLQFECLGEALDELVANRREDALGLIGILQKPWITGDLKNAWDAIRSAGKTIEEVRAMPSPKAEITPSVLAARLVRLVNGWQGKLTPVQATQRAELIEWAEVLANVDLSSLEAVRNTIKTGPLKLNRVPVPERPDLEELREGFQDLIAGAVDTQTAFFRQIVFDVLQRFDAICSERKKARGALDFNDLERRAIDLLQRNSHVRARVRTQFRQIMLDEYQDINEQQAELIRLIRGEDVFFAVGDVNQSIYGFRHARPDIFDEYRARIEKSAKHRAQLFDNFRSRAEILRCVEALLNSAEGIQARELRAGASFDEKTNPSIEILRVLDDDKDEACEREARWIAHRILEIGAEFRDYAVLCRNGESMKPILAEFDRVGIPYVCGRRQSFLLAREGLNITALLHVVANPRDSIALATVLRSSLVGISDEALLAVRLLAGSLTSGLNMIAFDSSRLADFQPNDREKLERFTAGLKRWRADLQLVPLDVLIGRILSDCGFQWTPGSVEGDNVEAFLHLARTRGAERSLLDFLRELESIEGAISTESDLSDEDQGNCVQVMTAHAAKGLEFPITIIAAMDKGTRRESAPVTFTPEHGLGIKWKDPNSEDGLKDSWALANSERLKQREKEESNRLLYVAMTRAEEHLILSYTCGRQRPGNWAKRLDDFFELTRQPPSSQAVVLRQDGFDVSVLVTDTDPVTLNADAVTHRNQLDIAVLPHPAVSEQYDTAANVTSLAVFAKCPRKYYIERYVGWSGTPFGSSETASELSAADLGSFVHEVLAGKPGPFPPEAHQLANVFLESDLGRRAQKAERSDREWDFIAELEGTLVRGTVDLWFEENGDIHLVDYKTDALARPADYAPQLALYALAIERAFGKRPAHAWLHFLRPDIVAEVSLDDESLSQARRLIGALRDAQQNLKFELNEGAHCHSCQFFRSLCPAAYASAR